MWSTRWFAFFLHAFKYCGWIVYPYLYSCTICMMSIWCLMASRILCGLMLSSEWRFKKLWLYFIIHTTNSKYSNPINQCTICELRSCEVAKLRSCELRVASCELRVASWIFRISSISGIFFNLVGFPLLWKLSGSLPKLPGWKRPYPRGIFREPRESCFSPPFAAFRRLTLAPGVRKTITPTVLFDDCEK